MCSINRDPLPPIVLLGLCLAFAVVLSSGADFRLADTLYQWQGGRWALRDHWLFAGLLHRGARQLMLLLLLLLAVLWLWKMWHSEHGPVRTAMGYLLLSAIASVFVVSLVKQLSGIACPWSLQIYGGPLPISDACLPRGPGRCFPAGHASSAYAWFGLYFIARTMRAHWRYPALLLLVLLGISFGTTQQLRGAHFLSHDIATAWICWAIAWAMSAVMLPSVNHKYTER